VGFVENWKWERL